MPVSCLVGRSFLPSFTNLTVPVNAGKRSYVNVINAVVRRYLNVSSMTPADERNDALRVHCQTIFRRGVEAVQPHKMIPHHVEVIGKELVTAGRVYKLAQNVHVVGFGKGVLGMARQVEKVLGEHIQRGLISVPVGLREEYLLNGKEDLLLSGESRIEMREGARNNLPDLASYHSAMRIREIVTSMSSKDLLIVLISGGGSALLSAPEPPISLDDFTAVTRILGQNGATIQELNTIRKNIDEFKGGGLARLAHPASVLSLILSDICDDPLDLISSGPTVLDKSTPQQCLAILRKLHLQDIVPSSVLNFLKERDLNSYNRVENKEFEHVQNIIVGSNAIALEQCGKTAKELGYVVYELSRNLSGEARDVARTMAKLANYIALVHRYRSSHSQANRDLVAVEMNLIQCGIMKSSINEIVRVANQASNSGASICIISGGETVVNVGGNGKGGRNQELALAFAMALDEEMSKAVRDSYDVQFLSAGTDGQDAATDAAGALADLTTMQRARSQELSAAEFLNDNDSYHFFEKLSGGVDHVKTGLTGTNVMDICVMLVRAKN